MLQRIIDAIKTVWHKTQTPPVVGSASLLGNLDACLERLPLRGGNLAIGRYTGTPCTAGLEVGGESLRSVRNQGDCLGFFRAVVQAATARLSATDAMTTTLKKEVVLLLLKRLRFLSPTGSLDSLPSFEGAFRANATKYLEEKAPKKKVPFG